MIAEFTGKYRFLSNFWSCFITYEGVIYPSVENAYQAAKCKNASDRERFVNIKASEAKKLGKVVEMRPDWEEIVHEEYDPVPVKISIMYSLVEQKFSTNPLKRFLLETGDEEMQEGNYWGDTYWGTVNGWGKNHLGKILMKVREELK